MTRLGRNRTGRATLGILRIVAVESALTLAEALLYSRKDRFGCPRATVWTGGEGPEDDGAEAWRKGGATRVRTAENLLREPVVGSEEGALLAAEGWRDRARVPWADGSRLGCGGVGAAVV